MSEKVEQQAIKDFRMEHAMMSDMVALEVIGAMIQSDLSRNLEHPMSQITAIGFAFAKEYLRQRENWLKPKEEKDAPVGSEVDRDIKPSSIIV